MWQRCTLGQTWDESTQSCTGNIDDFTFSQAQQQAKASRIAGYVNWRLPSKVELESIVEESCWSPMVDLNDFPNTAPAWYWTAQTAENKNKAWYIHFDFGGMYSTLKSNKGLVRLVRDYSPTH